ncbi:MAG TPA: glycosyl hydrolase family 65 protein [Candidatus Limnocylindrales bacterium]
MIEVAAVPPIADPELPVAEPGPRIAAVLRNAAGVTIELLENGAVFAIRHGDILVNQVLGSPVEGGLGNVYLRRRTRGGATFVPLLGPAFPSRFRADADGATWEGSIDNLDYKCTLRLDPTALTWFWTVEVTNRTGKRLSLDAVLAQDLGLAREDVVRSSEAYTSQYIDHTVLRAAGLGVLACSRQNMPQDGAVPWIMHGCLDGAAGFLTDAVQLYGLEYRASNVPVALGRRNMPNRVYQFELALPTIQSRSVSLREGATARFTFFATYEPDHPTVTGPADVARALRAGMTFGNLDPLMQGVELRPRQRPAGIFDAPVMFESRDLDSDELERRFGADWRHVERREGELLSFFHGYQQHVVLRAKERVSERPTGLIMRSGRDLIPSDDMLSATAWMFGVFASQVTIGNTSFNKLLSVARHPLNVLKSSGQRIFVRTRRGYELLGVPSAFEMGPSSARWIYAGDELTLDIRVTTSLDAPVCRLTIDVERGGPIELLITSNVVLGRNEFDAPGTVEVDIANARVQLRAAADSPLRLRYPETTFFITCADPDAIDAIGRDELLYTDGIRRDGEFVVVRTKPVTHVSLAMTGSILDAGAAERLATRHAREADPDEDPERTATAFWSALARGAMLGGAKGRHADDVARLNDVIRWYVHDAMIHYLTPRGLEQYSGGAWGLRDVCQGPAELLVATGNTAPLGDVIKLVYEHQYRRSGDWPQWFMFDRFRDVQAPGSHADIIHWPIKALCDYVEATGDLTILDERVAFTDDDTLGVTDETESILAHTERQIARIEQDCIPGTALPVFAGGDWEDTLQPADRTAARHLVSPWTVALAYQTLGRYRIVCDRAGAVATAERLAGLCDRLRADFERYLVPDGVVAGFAHFASDGIEYLLHPRDRLTGVTYRLIPMTRGIISGLFTPEQAARHADLIERHLLFPDGVRLQNRPTEYSGGTSRIFLRAETAANFGREVGLQYVHAHIRYIEAMAVLGRPEAAFHGLLAVCPILLERDVPSALPRQSNAYFSSSDAAFTDRRQASRRFGWIRSGRVGLRGGWRVYSSGPGIYVNQLISNVLGLRAHYDDLVFDPVLPPDADGLTFDFEYQGRRVRYLFHVTGAGPSPREVLVNGRPLPAGRYSANPYRAGGFLVAKAVFAEALDHEDNLVEILV